MVHARNYFSSLPFLCVALGLIFLLLETSLCLSEGTIARQKPSEILKPPALGDQMTSTVTPNSRGSKHILGGPASGCNPKGVACK